ncbi:MAG TPA: hypothetical protein VFV92_02960 [Candidatus Bathyarchaeia archaeon]|nr:hypothetical protein [Candidatus Bathyarchaeia archaeon]
MKMKIAPIALVAFSIIAAVLVVPIHATFSPMIYARTDKSSYLPGDSGTLFITVRNEGTQSFGVKNLTITYPWKAFLTDHWDGNNTYTFTGVALSQGGTWNQQYSFTVPTDGRASFSIFGGSITIRMGTDISPPGPAFVNSAAAIQIAAATYEPFGIATSIIPIVSLVLLGLAVAMLALLYMSMRKQAKK